MNYLPVMKIQEYQSRYKSQIMAIFNAHVPQFFAPSERKELDHYLTHELEKYFVIIEKDKVIGCGGINFPDNGREARLSWDMVAPNHMGRGAGGQLVLHRLNIIRQTPGVGSIIVRTTPMTEGFYRRLGFLVKSRQKDYWATGYDLVVMEHPL